MKITNVSFENNIQSNKYKKENNNLHTSFINPNEIFKKFDVTNKYFVSFKNAEAFEESADIDESYFKLPAGVSPDKSQKIAAAELEQGKDVLVTMPTGMGKTAIAHYIISKNMQEGKRTFYTTPLKALSNQKIGDFQKLYGKDNVGILTGDVKIRPDAPIVVMTTEIYRNMVFADRLGDSSKGGQLDNLGTVVFDEMHYLGDYDRGAIWESSVILSPRNVQLLALSATIGNNGALNDWISNIRGQECSLVNVDKSKRPVPLEYHDMCFAKGQKPGKKGKQDVSVSLRKQLEPEHYFRMVKMLQKHEKLPAIFFIFSKNTSRKLLSEFSEEGEFLTTRDEEKAINKILDEYQSDGKYMSGNFDVRALRKGYAIHNSSLMPSEKELIENLFKKKLIKVVLSTETLAAGINMPARTTVITSCDKPSSGKGVNERGRRTLTPNEFHQMAGRAGRRGMDSVGYVYSMSANNEQAKVFEGLYNSEPNDLESQFNPDFSFIAEYYKHTQNDEVMEDLLSKSFYIHDDNEDKRNIKLEQMMTTFKDDVAILQKFKFLNDDKTLTDKGRLVSALNGFEQILIINSIYSKRLPLEPIKLAACVGALASTNENNAARIARDSREKDKGHVSASAKVEFAEFEHKDAAVSQFVNGLEKYLEKYNGKMKENGRDKSVAQDKNVSKHVYDWAELNSHNKDSVENWEKLCTREMFSSGADEGTIFKEINLTMGLLKQIAKIAKVGVENSTNDEDREYYVRLINSAKGAIELLNKEPVKPAEI